MGKSMPPASSEVKRIKVWKGTAYGICPLHEWGDNETAKNQIQKDTLLQELVKKYYKFAVMCLLWIKESIDTWKKHSGADGYFDFIEGYMGREIKGNDMNFSIMSLGILDM